MVCSERKAASEKQSKVISLSQLDYRKSDCPIQDGSCNLCQEILTVEQNIEKAIAGLKKLLSRQQHLKTQINHTHSPIIRQLPVELLSKIFYLCFSDEMRRDDGGPIYADFYLPLNFGAVCHTWRQVAWSSPELWTIIRLKRHYRSASYACNQYIVMKEWVSRSGALPLYVTLSEFTAESANVGRVAEGCHCWELSLELLAQCSHRWKDAYLDLSGASFEYIARKVKPKPPTRMLTLASKDMAWTNVHDSSEALQLWPNSEFEYGPYHLTMRYPVQLGHFSVDWKHVTHVTADGWLLEECARLLKNTPQLVSCSFREIGDFGEESQSSEVGWPPAARHVHTSLRYLVFHSEVYAAAFFDSVALPSLEELHYSNDCWREEMDNPFLIPFFIQSGFALKNLSLDAYTFTPLYLISVLSWVPSVTQLLLYFTDCSPGTEDREMMVSLFMHLAKTAKTTTSSSRDTGSHVDNFLPRLEVLELSDWRLDFPWTFVPDIFGYPPQLGTEGRRPLKSLILDIWKPLPVQDGLPGDVVSRLVTLQEAGVNISYRIMSSELAPVTWASR
ncbi:hypothetical protein CPC08DRAFT_296624 [Agrocybe pediades]|nr:hypothetical protein CPC08DRAFT_296624 [Agrocybe pediades]